MEELADKDNFDQLTKDVDQARFDLSVELGREPRLREIVDRLEKLGLIPEIKSEPDPKISKEYNFNPSVEDEIFSLRETLETMVDGGMDEGEALDLLTRKGWNVSVLRSEYEAKQKELENVH